MSTKQQHPPPDQNTETLIQQIRALPRAFWVLCVGIFIHRFGAFIYPFLTLYLNEKGFGTGAISIIFASLAFGGIVAMFVGGQLTDQIGRKNTMTIALVGGSIAGVLMYQSESVLAFAITGFLWSVTMGMYHPASKSLLADIVPEARRITAFSVFRWAVNVGFALGMAAGGFLAERSYALLFYGDAITSMIFAIIAYFLLPHGISTTRALSKWSVALPHIIANRQFMVFAFATFLVVICMLQWGTTIAILITDLGYRKEIFGWIMAFNGLLIITLEIPIGQIGRNLPMKKVIALGFLLSGIGVALCGFATPAIGILVFGIAMTVFTFGEMISMPSSSAYINLLAPDEMRGRYNAVVGVAFNLGSAIGPALGLLLYRSEANFLWFGSLALGVAAAGLMCQKETSIEA